MKEVTHEQAKKLSDFGFTERSEQAYLVHQKSGNYKLCSPFGRMDYNQNNGRDNTNKTAIYYSAPTFSQALQWIRDKFYLHGLVDCNASGWFWSIQKTNGTFIQDWKFTGNNEDGYFDTLPEAEHALLDALLIYIEKKQLNKNK